MGLERHAGSLGDLFEPPIAEVPVEGVRPVDRSEEDIDQTVPVDVLERQTGSVGERAVLEAGVGRKRVDEVDPE